MTGTLLNIDAGIILYLQEHLRNPILNSVMVGITKLGDGGTIWIAATLVLLFFKKTRKVGIISVAALLGTVLINNGCLKLLVQRLRPFYTFQEIQILVPTPREFSFPSGHTSSAFAAATVFYRKLPKEIGISAVVLAGLIGFSRIYVGVHYPTDVLVGAVLGTVVAFLCVSAAEHFWNEPERI